jgi:hypothetical protein
MEEVYVTHGLLPHLHTTADSDSIVAEDATTIHTTTIKRHITVITVDITDKFISNRQT